MTSSSLPRPIVLYRPLPRRLVDGLRHLASAAWQWLHRSAPAPADPGPLSDRLLCDIGACDGLPSRSARRHAMALHHLADFHRGALGPDNWRG